MGEVLGDVVLTCPDHDDLCFEAGVQLSDILDAATKRFGAGGFSYKKGEKTYMAAPGSRVPEGTYKWEVYPPAAGVLQPAPVGLLLGSGSTKCCGQAVLVPGQRNTALVEI